MVMFVAIHFEAKLDVYARSDVTTPQPTMIWIHGGGWTGGNKEGATFSLLPYMEMGWNVVNVEYRLAKISLAPAAVEDRHLVAARDGRGDRLGPEEAGPAEDQDALLAGDRGGSGRTGPRLRARRERRGERGTGEGAAQDIAASEIAPSH